MWQSNRFMNDKARGCRPAASTSGGVFPRPIVQYSKVFIGTRRYKAASERPYMGSSALSCCVTSFISPPPRPHSNPVSQVDKHKPTKDKRPLERREPQRLV